MVAGALLAGMGAQARAQADGEGAGPIRGDVVIWASARSASAAGEQLRELQHLLAPLAPFLRAPGAAVVESARLEGLKPGAFVVTLGICRADKVGPALKVFRALRPEVASKAVTYRPAAGDPDLPCPAASAPSQGGEDASPWQPGTPAVTSAGSLRFIGLPFSRPGEAAADVASSHAGLSVLFLLVDLRKRALVDSAEYRPPTEAVVVRAFVATPRGLALKVEYADPPCDGRSERFVLWRAEVTASNAGAAVRLEEAALTRLREGACGDADAPEAVPARKAVPRRADEETPLLPEPPPS